MKAIELSASKMNLAAGHNRDDSLSDFGLASAGSLYGGSEGDLANMSDV